MITDIIAQLIGLSALAFTIGLIIFVIKETGKKD